MLVPPSRCPEGLGDRPKPCPWTLGGDGGNRPAGKTPLSSLMMPLSTMLIIIMPLMINTDSPPPPPPLIGLLQHPPPLQPPPTASTTTAKAAKPPPPAGARRAARAARATGTAGRRLRGRDGDWAETRDLRGPLLARCLRTGRSGRGTGSGWRKGPRRGTTVPSIVTAGAYVERRVRVRV